MNPIFLDVEICFYGSNNMGRHLSSCCLLISKHIVLEKDKWRDMQAMCSPIKKLSEPQTFEVCYLLFLRALHYLGIMKVLSICQS